MSTYSMNGTVSLVGAGPGDPELLTVKAVKAIQKADVLIFDNLVSDAIQTTFPATALPIFVGKSKGCHSMSQDDINTLMLKYATQGKRVCRVKGGDAFIFGRGSEEMLFLSEHGIQVDVIPGITAASGCTTYADIPLTHRGLSQSCTFITAHADKELSIDWQALVQLNQTLVIYMGLSKARQIQTQLLQHGMNKRMPVAIIEKGCTKAQRNLLGELHELADLAERQHIESPALIVIGKVITIAEQMASLKASLDQKQHDYPALYLPLTA